MASSREYPVRISKAGLTYSITPAQSVICTMSADCSIACQSLRTVSSALPPPNRNCTCEGLVAQSFDLSVPGIPLGVRSDWIAVYIRTAKGG